MKLIYIPVLALFISLELCAQNYTSDAGIRVNQGVTITYRQFFKEDMALEGYISYRDRSVRIGGAREFFKPAFTQYSESIRLYYGYGVHAGVNYTNHHRLYNREYRYEWKASPVFGMDGILGLEYRMKEVPFLLAVDIRPFFEFSLNEFFQLRPFDVSFSLKYRF